jgi:hypothetical protein
MRLARPPQKLKAACMEAHDLDVDALSLDAVDTVLLATLEQLGDDPEARFGFFRRLLEVARETVQERVPAERL